jgi:hypothetical protein
MHPSQMYVLTQLEMAEAQADAARSRMVADCRPEPLWRVVVAGVRRPGARGGAARAPVARPERAAS